MNRMQSGMDWGLREPSESFKRMTDKLSASSMRLRWEAHRDIPWDDPQMEISDDDLRWVVPPWDPLGASSWYQGQPLREQARIGLGRTSALFKAVIEFEATLQHGLLIFASTLPNRHPAFRYIYHELTEEAQHTMMFQEFIDRAGVDPPRTPRTETWDLQRVTDLVEGVAPVIFFLGAVSGEEGFDHMQRRILASEGVHPLLEAITRIHCAEEARHISFARALLREVVPRLDARTLRVVRYQAPVVIDSTIDQGLEILETDAGPRRIPPDVARAASEGPAAEELRRAGARKLVALCRDIGLLDEQVEPLWRSRGLL